MQRIELVERKLRKNLFIYLFYSVVIIYRYGRVPLANGAAVYLI